MAFFRRVMGMVWDSISGRYVKPLHEFEVDQTGTRRDYGYTFDDKGQRVRSGVPGEDRIAEPRDPIAELAKELDEPESWVRGLYSDDFPDI